MTIRSLMKWRIFRILQPNFISKIHMVIVHGNMGCAAMIVMKDGTVYGLGNNSSGCLGTGDTRNTLYPREIKALSGKGIKTFACTVGQTLAVTEKGEVYSWGHPYRTGQGYVPTCEDLTPTLVEFKVKEVFVVDIACGKHHSVVLTNNGKLYAWGLNHHRQVDNRKDEYTNTNVSRCVDIVLEEGDKILCIGCCSASSMAVVGMGQIYSWGHNINGELGIGHYHEMSGVCTVKIPYTVKIEKVACGHSHVLALSQKGVLYVWGNNTYGQLGLGHKNNTPSPVQLQVKEMGRVLDIAASPYNNISVAMGEDNRVFVWGQCLEQSVVVPTLTSLECLHDAFVFYATCSVMHQPLIVHSEKTEMSLMDHLTYAFNDVTTSDLTINVWGKPIHVHKAILKIRCLYFRTMFQEHWAENNQCAIEHEQFSYDVYRAFLKYLYTDQIELPAENIGELLDLAITYCDSVLKERCIQLIKSEIGIENVVLFYYIGIKYDLKELEDFCFEFALNNMTAVIQTPNFSELDEFAAKSFIIKAAKACAFRT